MIGKTNNYWRTNFDWTNFYQSCYSTNGLAPYTNYYSQPTTWIISDGIYHPGTPAVPPVCGPITAGSKPNINHTTAATINVAFNVEGFGGTSQTGYTSGLSIEYHYGENGWLCGDTLWPNSGFGWPMAIP